LALIAVLPSTRRLHLRLQGRREPGKFAPLALANMTGGNRLLIGGRMVVVVLLPRGG